MAFAFLLFYVAVVLVRPQEWYEPVQGLELVNFAATMTILATFTTKGTQMNQALAGNKHSRLMWGLYLGVVLSQISHGHLSRAMEGFTEFGKIAVFFFLVVLIVDSPSRVSKLMWTIVFSATLLSFNAWMQVHTGRGFGDITPFGSWESEDFRVRGSGQFNDPNDFAILYLMSVPFVFALYRTANNGFQKVLLVATLPGMLYTLYYTQSRGAVVGFCAMLFIYLWQSGKLSFGKVVLTVGLLGAIMAFGPARARASYEEGSAAGRVIEWGVGNGFLKQYPLFGIGWDEWSIYERTTAHSSFVKCYAELGLVGYVFWFSLFWLVCRKLRVVLNHRQHVDLTTYNLALGLQAALVGHMVAAFFLSRTYHHPIFFLEGLGIAMLSYVRRQSPELSKLLELRQIDFRKSFTAALLSIPMIWLIIKIYWRMGGASD